MEPSNPRASGDDTIPAPVEPHPPELIGPELTELEERGLRSRSRRGFAVGGVSALAALAGWRWLGTRPAEQGIPWPLRRVLAFNEHLAEAVFRPSRLAPEFPRKVATTPRLNGQIGLDPAIDTARWSLRVVGQGGEPAAKQLKLQDVQALPRVEMTTELRCIEGWSTVVHWAGARLADLVESTRLAYKDGSELFRYVSFATPDAAYYVGLDMPSALHPQTLLCYEMDGRPLAPRHGAPLRLVIPVKYGIKHLKQIGTIRFTDSRPADYWAERGYDWYSGH